MPVSIFSLSSNLDDGVEWWRAYNYRHWLYKFEDFKLTEFFDPKNHSTILASPNKFHSILRIFEYYRAKDFEPRWSRTGWGKDYKSTSSADDLLLSGKAAAKRHQSKNYFNEISLVNLKKIFLICQSRNIRLLIITTPAYDAYRMQLESSRLGKMQTVVSDLIASNKNMLYINYLSDNRFESNDFYDADHLNHNGAEKFSRILNDDIENMMSK